MRFFTRKAKPVPAPAAPVVIEVSLEAMNAAFPDRAAGRWCDHCQQNGAHHTDRHNDFATAALAKQA